MATPPDDSSPSPDGEVRYSSAFLAERERSTRRGLLGGGLACLVLGSIVLHDTFIAIDTGRLVSFGRTGHGSGRWPPFIAGPVAAFLVIAGVGLLIARVTRRKR